LASGNYCVSHTVHAGAEYSGRGGLRVFTVVLLASPEALARFANNPFRLLEAATAAGYADVLDPASERLEPIQLSCVATPVDRILLARLARHPGPHAMAALVDGILREGLLAVESRVPLRRLIAGLFSLLPVELRPLFSFSTGLKLSRQRSFRIQPLDPDTPRGGARRAGDPVPLLLDQRASQLEVSHPWSELASHVLCTGAAASLCQALSIPRPDLLGPFDQASRNLAALAQRLGKAAREPLAVG
jgi:hypothetical protein